MNKELNDISDIKGIMDDKICSICCESKKLKKLQCDHSFCKDCLRTFIMNEINDRKYEIFCPNRCCYSELSYNFIDNLIKDEYIIKKLDRNIVIHTVNSSDNLKFCPKCDSIAEKDNDDTMICNDCGYKFCYVCNYKKNYDHSCNFDTLNEIKDALESKEVKLCPKCCAFIHKYQGCDSIRCVNCKFRFCWNCLKLYKNIKDEDEHKNNCQNFRGYGSDNSSDPSDDYE